MNKWTYLRQVRQNMLSENENLRKQKMKVRFFAHRIQAISIYQKISTIFNKQLQYTNWKFA